MRKNHRLIGGEGGRATTARYGPRSRVDTRNPLCPHHLLCPQDYKPGFGWSPAQWALFQQEGQFRPAPGVLGQARQLEPQPHPVLSAVGPIGRPRVLWGLREPLNRALHSWPQAGPCMRSAHCTLQTESIIYLKGAAPQFLASQESHPSWCGRVSQAVELCLHWLKESLYFIKQADRRISRHRRHIDGFNFPNLQMHPLCPRVAAGCGLMPSQSKNQAEFY